MSTSRILPFSPWAIYGAFASPDLLAQWWGPDGFTNTFEVFEFKPGGVWKFVMHGPDGKSYQNDSLFSELEPGRKVVIEHVCAPCFTLTIRLDPVAGGTQIAWEQVFADAETARAVKAIVGPANEQNLDRMTQVLAQHAQRMAAAFPAEGGCDCRMVRYRMETAPLFVHCCHCRWCQRESGASFALNAMIEADRVTELGAPPELVNTPSESGRGQLIARCPHCKVAVWSHYAGAGPLVKFIRVGTLDNPDILPPDIHIFTASKQPWVVLPGTTPVVAEYYERENYWPPESISRRAQLLPLIEAYHAAKK